MRGEAQAALDDAIEDWFLSHGQPALFTDQSGASRSIRVIEAASYSGSSPLNMEIENEQDVVYVRSSEVQAVQRDCWLTIGQDPSRMISSVKPHRSRGVVRLTLSDL